MRQQILHAALFAIVFAAAFLAPMAAVALLGGCARSAPGPVIEADVQRVVCGKTRLVKDVAGVEHADAGCDP